MFKKRGSLQSMLGNSQRKKIKKRIEYVMGLFNKNLKYAGFSILLYQKRKIREEVELFLTKEKNGN
ncbi:MAG: hypothetical protein QME12_07060 [Nanoarchaeota archaeon]|nr:hypothetical protein [Nanoarchaeota archaeon]